MQEDFENKVCECYIVGVRHTCGKKIMRDVFNKKVGRVTNSAVADRFSVNRSTVGRWRRDGAIDLDRLILLMVEFGFDFNLLCRPQKENLAIGGYMRATTFVLEMIISRPVEPITAEQFCCIRSLQRRQGEWIRLQHSSKQSETASCDLKAFAESVAKESDQLFASYFEDVLDGDCGDTQSTPTRVQYRTPEQLDELERMWGEAADHCLAAVYQYSWLS